MLRIRYGFPEIPEETAQTDLMQNANSLVGSSLLFDEALPGNATLAFFDDIKLICFDVVENLVQAAWP